MEWTKSLSYKPYNYWSNGYKNMLVAGIQNSEWKPAFHIHPKMGLLNDPNGFSYYNGKWHLFYQAYPFGPVHGVKSWYHMTSDNLVDWEENDFVILPDTIYDSHGAYSGSGITVGDRLFLMYTGNVRNENWERHSYQLGAWMDSQFHIKKMEKPLIENPPAGYTHEFRDPQVFRYNNEYLMLIGAQTENSKGTILTYQSKDLTNWEFSGELEFTTKNMGFMVECPNLVFANNQPILLFCPQGIDKNVLPYQNIFTNAYVVGESFDREKISINYPTELVNLDEGFDLYATQAFNAPDGRLLSVGWVGLPEIDYPSFKEEWAHCLSIVKELSIKNNHLYQTPVEEMKTLRESCETIKGKAQEDVAMILSPVENKYELKLELETGSSGNLYLFADETNKESLKLSFDERHHILSIDRSNSGISFAESYGNIRTAKLNKQDKLLLHIFVDYSVCEVFINNGHRVMTSRIFLKNKNNTHIFLEGFTGNYSGNLWNLREMN